MCADQVGKCFILKTVKEHCAPVSTRFSSRIPKFIVLDNTGLEGKRICDRLNSVTEGCVEYPIQWKLSFTELVMLEDWCRKVNGCLMLKSKNLTVRQVPFR